MPDLGIFPHKLLPQMRALLCLEAAEGGENHPALCEIGKSKTAQPRGCASCGGALQGTGKCSLVHPLCSPQGHAGGEGE